MPSGSRRTGPDVDPGRQGIVNERPRIIFVGAFPASSTLHGGQISDCTSLMLTDFSRVLDVVTIDSTQVSIPPPAFTRRLRAAAARFVHFAAALTHRPSAALIFLADGASFVEKGMMALIAGWLGIRTVIAPRSGFLLDDYQRSRLMRAMIRRVLASVDVVICQSPFWAETFKGWGADPARCVVLKNWIDAAPFSSICEVDETDGQLRLLFLGWVDQNKGIFELLRAVALLRAEGRTVTLVVAGAGKDLARARSLSSELQIDDVVSFVGWAGQDLKRQLLERCHVLAVPSHREGLPNAMLEGMAAGRAIVASTVGGIPDVLRDSGAGLLHPAGDVQALAESIRSYDDDRVALADAGRKARASIARNHSLEAAWPILYSCLTRA
jgi:glycosyltransferase involved in cell wall biosynthesis